MAENEHNHTSNEENKSYKDSSKQVVIWDENGNITTKYFNTYGKNDGGVPIPPKEYNIEKVAATEDITASKWIEIKANIVQEYKRAKISTDYDSIFSAVVGNTINADDFNNLREYTNWNNTIPEAHPEDDITASMVNAIIDEIIDHGNLCICNCNYCSCNCNYCTCNCNYEKTKTVSGTYNYNGGKLYYGVTFTQKTITYTNERYFTVTDNGTYCTIGPTSEHTALVIYYGGSTLTTTVTVSGKYID